MWILTPRGFFSAVQKDAAKPHRITVRARSSDDLDSLRELIPDAIDVPSALWADYPFRVECSSADWATACARMALEVDYSNFKDEVKRVQGTARSSIYMGVWSRLLDIEGPGGWSARNRLWWDEQDELDDEFDALPGSKLDAALAEVAERGDRKVASPSQRRKKQAKQQKKQPTRRRAPRGRSR